jgi:hypothetical protein
MIPEQHPESAGVVIRGFRNFKERSTPSSIAGRFEKIPDE